MENLRVRAQAVGLSTSSGGTLGWPFGDVVERRPHALGDSAQPTAPSGNRVGYSIAGLSRTGSGGIGPFGPAGSSLRVDAAHQISASSVDVAELPAAERRWSTRRRPSDPEIPASPEKTCPAEMRSSTRRLP